MGFGIAARPSCALIAVYLKNAFRYSLNLAEEHPFSSLCPTNLCCRLQKAPRRNFCRITLKDSHSIDDAVKVSFSVFSFLLKKGTAPPVRTSSYAWNWRQYELAQGISLTSLYALDLLFVV